jgi:DNA polymerase III epsilon subunit family exonuclease
MRYSVVDLETTGLSRYAHRITEIAAVRVEDGRVVKTFQSLVNPEVRIPSFITHLTGIDNEMVRQAPTIEEALPAALRFLGSDLVVAHNASFDHGFLSANAARQGRAFENEKLCTRRLANRLVPELPSKRLQALCEHFKINNQQAHRAMGDTLATHELFLKLQNIMDQQGIKEENYQKFAQQPRRTFLTRIPEIRAERA